MAIYCLQTSHISVFFFFFFSLKREEKKLTTSHHNQLFWLFHLETNWFVWFMRLCAMGHWLFLLTQLILCRFESTKNSFCKNIQSFLVPKNEISIKISVESIRDQTRFQCNINLIAALFYQIRSVMSQPVKIKLRKQHTKWERWR